jgi:hypothetical protein
MNNSGALGVFCVCHALGVDVLWMFVPKPETFLNFKP